MKRFQYVILSTIIIVFSSIFFLSKQTVNANDRIYAGVYIGNIDVSGMTKDEAYEEVCAYINEMKECQYEFVVARGQLVQKRIGDFEPVWNNPEVIDEAFNLGNEGNVIQRYKALKDIEYKGVVFELDISFDKELVRQFIEEECCKYDLPVEDARLSRVDGQFQIEDGTAGEIIDVDASVEYIDGYLYKYYADGHDHIYLDTIEIMPEHNRENLVIINDVLGSYTTDYSNSSQNRSLNVERAAELLNGITLYPGEELSTYGTVAPFSEANGYYMAPSYAGGQVVDSMGGGICQVSSALYNAVLKSELEVTVRSPHSMVVAYVPKSADAAISDSGKDFRFVNNTEYPIYIECISSNKKITINIYGVETRPAGRTVEYISETVEEIIPEGERIILDSAAPVGTVTLTDVHVGYRARLLKVVYEDGEEVSREVINNSTYNATPLTASVGTMTSNPDYLSRIQAAAATGSIEACMVVASEIISEGVY